MVPAYPADGTGDSSDTSRAGHVGPGGTPEGPRDDPASLIRAVDELHAARTLWMADEAAFMARRRREKAVGRRHITADGGWRDRGRGSGGSLAHCPTPSVFPTEPLPIVVGRILRSRVPTAGAASACRACGSEAGTTGWGCGHYLHRLCAQCGVSLGSRETDTDRAVLAARQERWKEVWRRAV